MTGKIGDIKELQEVVSRPQILHYCCTDLEFYMSISIITTVLRFIFFQNFLFILYIFYIWRIYRKKFPIITMFI
jgi:hypothetical protein